MKSITKFLFAPDFVEMCEYYSWSLNNSIIALDLSLMYIGLKGVKDDDYDNYITALLDVVELSELNINKSLGEYIHDLPSLLRWSLLNSKLPTMDRDKLPSFLSARLKAFEELKLGTICSDVKEYLDNLENKS